MADIPSDVIYLSILPRLSVKSLLRFKSVSKSWQTWISSPEFIRLHSHRARSSDKSRFLVMLNGPSRTLHLHKLALPWAPPLLLPYPKTASTCTTSKMVKIIASSESVLLLKCSPRDYKRAVFVDSNQLRTRPYKSDKLVLLNPSTGSFREIPHPSIVRTSINLVYGLYLDEANNNYKVVMISQTHDSSPTERDVMVHSNKTNSWTLVEQKLDMFDRIVPKVTVIGHLLHTIIYSKNGKRIVCFDIVAEQWTNKIPLPDNFEVHNRRLYRLGVLDGLLCVGVKKLVDGLLHLVDYPCHYQVWVMKDYGVKESWVNLLNITGPFDHDYLPLTYSEESRHKILVQTRLNTLFWYDIRYRKAEKIAFDGGKAFLSGHTIRKESLVNFAGGRQINLRQSSNS